MARPAATDVLKDYTDAKTARSRRENDWRMATAYCMPRSYNDWTQEGPPAVTAGNSTAARRIAYDSTGARALPKYKAILERMATPHNMRWHGLTTGNKNLLKIRRVQVYFDQVTSLLFQARYEPRANFRQAMSEVYGSLGVYGTGPVYFGQRTPNALYRSTSLLYKACPLRDVFLCINDDGEVYRVIRRFWLNYRQFVMKFPGVTIPRCLALQTQNGGVARDNDYKEFIQVTNPRSDYDKEALDSRRHPITSSYICIADQVYVGDEEGYRSMPYLTPRADTEAGDPYGNSPALKALPSLGTASAVKKSMIKHGQKSAGPTLLAHDDGVVNGPMDLRPDAINYGAVNKDGRQLVHALPVGDFKLGHDMMQDERSDIEDSFFVQIFKDLVENPDLTATQAMEIIAKEGALLSPTMGRLQSELLAPGIGRELDMLDEMGRMPEMPPELIEARGEYEIVYTSPLAKSMYADEVAGFMKSVNFSIELVNATQDPSHLDAFNFKDAIPEMASYSGTPVRWLNDDSTKADIAESRKQAQAKEQMMKNAAPLAGALKTAASMQQGQPSAAPQQGAPA